MPSRRYLLVEGVPGRPAVCDPSAGTRHGDASRFVGHELDDCEHVEGKDESGRTRTMCAKHPDPEHVLEHYRVAQHVVVDAPELRFSIKCGELKLVAECVAKGFDEAREKLQPPPAGAPAPPRSPAPSPAPAASAAPPAGTPSPATSGA